MTLFAVFFLATTATAFTELLENVEPSLLLLQASLGVVQQTEERTESHAEMELLSLKKVKHRKKLKHHKLENAQEHASAEKPENKGLSAHKKVIEMLKKEAKSRKEHARADEPKNKEASAHNKAVQMLKREAKSRKEQKSDTVVDSNETWMPITTVVGEAVAKVENAVNTRVTNVIAALKGSEASEEQVDDKHHEEDRKAKKQQANKNEELVPSDDVKVVKPVAFPELEAEKMRQKHAKSSATSSDTHPVLEKVESVVENGKNLVRNMASRVEDGVATESRNMVSSVEEALKGSQQAADAVKSDAKEDVNELSEDQAATYYNRKHKDTTSKHNHDATEQLEAKTEKVHNTSDKLKSSAAKAVNITKAEVAQSASFHEESKFAELESKNAKFAKNVSYRVESEAEAKGCNWQCYLNRYPRLSYALKGSMNAAREHWLKHGRAADRNCKCDRGQQDALKVAEPNKMNQTVQVLQVLEEQRQTSSEALKAREVTLKILEEQRQKHSEALKAQEVVVDEAPTLEESMTLDAEVEANMVKKMVQGNSTAEKPEGVVAGTVTGWTKEFKSGTAWLKGLFRLKDEKLPEQADSLANSVAEETVDVKKQAQDKQVKSMPKEQKNDDKQDLKEAQQEEKKQNPKKDSKDAKLVGKKEGSSDQKTVQTHPLQEEVELMNNASFAVAAASLLRQPVHQAIAAEAKLAMVQAPIPADAKAAYLHSNRMVQQAIEKTAVEDKVFVQKAIEKIAVEDKRVAQDTEPTSMYSSQIKDQQDGDEVESLMLDPAQDELARQQQLVFTKMTSDLTALKQTMSYKEQEASVVVQTLRVQYHNELEQQRMNTTTLSQQAKAIIPEIELVNDNIDRARRHAALLRKQYADLKLELVAVQANLTVAQEFINKSLLTPEGEGDKLEILQKLAEQDASKSEEKEHAAMLAMIEGKNSAALLQYNDHPEDVLISIGEKFSELDKEEKASVASLKEKYEKEMESETRKQRFWSDHIDRMSAEKASSEALLQKVRDAEGQLVQTNWYLKKHIESLRKFSTRLSSLSVSGNAKPVKVQPVSGEPDNLE